MVWKEERIESLKECIPVRTRSALEPFSCIEALYSAEAGSLETSDARSALSTVSNGARRTCTALNRPTRKIHTGDAWIARRR
jgi:hypothetical protein